MANESVIDTLTKRQPPVHIPLSFGDAIRGLLAVDPKQLPPRPGKKKAAKKAASKKRVPRAKKG
jgi:hypothetical protein